MLDALPATSVRSEPCVRANAFQARHVPCPATELGSKAVASCSRAVHGSPRKQTSRLGNRWTDIHVSRRRGLSEDHASPCEQSLDRRRCHRCRLRAHHRAGDFGGIFRNRPAVPLVSDTAARRSGADVICAKKPIPQSPRLPGCPGAMSAAPADTDGMQPGKPHGLR